MTQPQAEQPVDLPCLSGVDALRELLRRHLAGGEAAVPGDAWRAAARLMSEDARARCVQVEDLLVALKRTWVVLAERERAPRMESSRLLTSFVTLCVQEYYRPPG